MDSDGEGEASMDPHDSPTSKEEESSSLGQDEDDQTDSEAKSGLTPSAMSSLTGFLFGNIDEKGDLDEDFLDEESKRHLGSLSRLGIGSLVQEIADDSAVPATETTDENDDYDAKSPTAVDFSDITETAKEEEAEDRKPGREDEDGTDGSADEEDRKLMPPPSWLPNGGSISINTLDPGTSTVPQPPAVPVGKAKRDELMSPSSLSPSKKLNTPLADMMPPELANVDVTSIFPEFRHGQVLRFSRLFKPAHTPHIWRKKRKKKEEEEEEKKGKSEGKKEEGKSKDKDKEKKAVKEKKKEKEVQEVSAEMEKEETQSGGETSEKTGDERDAEKVKDEVGEKSEEEIDVEKGSEEDEGDEDDEEEELIRIQLDLGRPPKPEELMEDDEDKIKEDLNLDHQKGGSVKQSETEQEADVAPWRYGPAQYWYDHLGVDETGQGFQYDFKLKSDEDKLREKEETARIDRDLDYDKYLMVTQQRWEDKIIWNGEEMKQRVLGEHRKNAEYAGWVPSTNNRTFAQSRSQTGLLQRSKSLIAKPGLDSELGRDGEWHSIFPIENDLLIERNWEDDIIWDAQNMDRIPSPKVMTLDPNDENMILEIPDDIDPNQQTEQEVGGTKKEKESLRRSKILLGKAGILKDGSQQEEEVPNAVNAKDQFNLSNDEYYSPKQMDNALRPNIGSTVIQHSTPAAELRQPFFPTHMGPTKLRIFHRQPLKKYSHGALASYGPHPVQSLNKTIKKKAKIREQERQVFGGGDIFFMRTPQDLTGMDGEIILAEYSEEFPPLMMQVGMASKIKNYYKRKPGKDSNPPEYRYGELAYAHSSPFIGALKPGTCQQAMENNMFRSPVYEHAMPQSDFLVIRTRHGYFIREVEHIFTVGQEGPLMEVPGPNSKRANNFVRDFLQVFIYRLFWKSKDEPRRIKMEDIKRAFLSHSESSIRKRLKLCADFKRTGMDSNWWVLKPDFRLPTEEEIRAMVSPEQCCAWYSLITAEQRLKDAGYGEKSLFSPEEENEEDAQTKIDDEVRVAPWNTTRAYISAMKGKCLLQLNGLADPTGCGEGFSYIKVPNKPTTKEEAKETPVKKTVTGTDADLRRLNLQDAKQLLRKFGVHGSEIKKLSRWEVIDVVRTMSTEQAKQGTDATGWGKFARGNRYSAAEHMERYKEECQRIFDLQNRVLASSEALSTDEESTSGGEDSDLEEMGKNIEHMLSNKKTSSQLSREKEEQERRELQRIMKGELMTDKDKKGKAGASKEEESIMHGRKLKIVRTFHDDTGRQYQRSEMVTNPVVIDTYLRIRQTRDPNFIKQFAAIDDQQKEEMRKERRRLQEQLRRIKRNQEKPSAPTPPPKKKPKKEKELPIKASKMKCGACGQIGHMRTNKECPNYYGTMGGAGGLQVAMTEEQEEEEEKNLPADQDLINVEGTKIKMSKTLLEHAESIRRRSLVLKVPKQAVAEPKKKRRVSNIVHCDYLKKPNQSSNRRRTDPMVTLSSILESIVKELRGLPDIQLFLIPVNQRDVPDYYKIVKRPMDLQTMRENVRLKKYQSREDFLTDLHQIVENSKLYNGPQHLLTKNAQGMLDLCLKRFAEKEQKLMRLEKAINPLLDDNDQVALSFIFEEIIHTMKNLDNSRPFHAPVSKKTVKDYYSVIKKPMDLQTLLKNVQSHKYQHREGFIEDAELLYTNSLQYNGADSTITGTARKLMEVMKANLEEKDEHITQLESDIRLAQEAALDAADTDSMTGTSLNRDDGSLIGADMESLDGYSIGAKDNVTINEDDANSSHANFPEGSALNKSGSQMFSDSEFVDIEGDEESMHQTQIPEEDEDGDEEDEDALAKDLHISDNEEEEEEEDTMEDSLLESGDLTEDPVGEVEGYDENARLYFDGSQQEEAMDTEFSQGQYGEAGEEEEGDGFDPSEFFKNSTLALAQAQMQEQGGDQSAQQAAQQSEGEAEQSEVNINHDLEMSDDSDDDRQASQQEGSEDDPYPVIPTENQEAEGFDLDQW